jgi:hypothetical protein
MQNEARPQSLENLIERNKSNDEHKRKKRTQSQEKGLSDNENSAEALEEKTKLTENVAVIPKKVSMERKRIQETFLFNFLESLFAADLKSRQPCHVGSAGDQTD